MKKRSSTASTTGENPATGIPGLSVIIVSTGLGTILYLIKLIFTGDFTYIFLFWNLFLAALPLFFAHILISISGEKNVWSIEKIGAAILWLLFFPNAPYILTDFIHLFEYQYIFPAWYDAVMIGCFTLSGLLLGCLSLHSMQNYIRKHAGSSVSWILVILTILLSSFAIYIGRHIRLNSWDVFLQPVDTFAEMLRQMLSIGQNRSLRNIMIFFTLYQGLGYGIFLWMVAKKIQPQDPGRRHAMSLPAGGEEVNKKPLAS